jgi:hypothetical protein
MGYNPETGMYTPDKPVSTSTPFGQAGGNVGSIASTPSTVGSEYAQQLAASKKEAQKFLSQAKKSGNKEAVSMAQMTLDNIAQAENLVKTLEGSSDVTSNTGSLSNNRSDASYVQEGRSGTSSTGKNYINGELATPSEWSKFLLGDQNTGSSGAVNGSTNTAQGTAGGAYALLLSEFNKYGLGTLVEPLKDLIQQGLSPAEFSLALQNTTAYQKRFAANTDRISKGLSALSPAEYIALEDQYQNIMRNYGLPASYYAKGDLGVQEGFNKLLSNDVSPTELEDRVMTAQSRVINANPEIKQALRAFYPDVTDGEILAYSLDPTKALSDIKRKITAAEIGGAALGQGLATSRIDAEYLARYGVTKDQAQTGYSTIAEFLPTGQKLSQIYQESPYTQAQAESEVFKLADSAEAAKRRKKLSGLETASFSGSAGIGTGALNRDRAASNQTFGAGSY